MGLEPVERMVGEHTFRVIPFVGTKGYRLFLALSRAAAPSLARAAGSLDLDAETGEGVAELLEGIDFERLAGALETLAEKLPEETMWSLTERLLSSTEYRGGNGFVPVMSVFDTCFAQNYGALFNVLGLVLEVNYAGPLAGLLASVSGSTSKE